MTGQLWRRLNGRCSLRESLPRFWLIAMLWSLPAFATVTVRVTEQSTQGTCHPRADVVKLLRRAGAVEVTDGEAVLEAMFEGSDSRWSLVISRAGQASTRRTLLGTCSDIALASSVAIERAVHDIELRVPEVVPPTPAIPIVTSRPPRRQSDSPRARERELPQAPVSILADAGVVPLEVPAADADAGVAEAASTDVMVLDAGAPAPNLQPATPPVAPVVPQRLVGPLDLSAGATLWVPSVGPVLPAVSVDVGVQLQRFRVSLFGSVAASQSVEVVDTVPRGTLSARSSHVSATGAFCVDVGVRWCSGLLAGAAISFGWASGTFLFQTKANAIARPTFGASSRVSLLVLNRSMSLIIEAKLAVSPVAGAFELEGFTQRIALPGLDALLTFAIGPSLLP